jgi:hypothetical protein
VIYVAGESLEEQWVTEVWRCVERWQRFLGVKRGKRKGDFVMHTFGEDAQAGEEENFRNHSRKDVFTLFYINFINIYMRFFNQINDLARLGLERKCLYLAPIRTLPRFTERATPSASCTCAFPSRIPLLC